MDDEFIKEVAETVQPGHSALFLLVHVANLERWLDELNEFEPTVLQTSLAPQDEAKLREAFGAE